MQNTTIELVHAVCPCLQSAHIFEELQLAIIAIEQIPVRKMEYTEKWYSLLLLEEL